MVLFLLMGSGRSCFIVVLVFWWSRVGIILRLVFGWC